MPYYGVPEVSKHMHENIFYFVRERQTVVRKNKRKHKNKRKNSHLNKKVSTASLSGSAPGNGMYYKIVIRITKV